MKKTLWKIWDMYVPVKGYECSRLGICMFPLRDMNVLVKGYECSRQGIWYVPTMGYDSSFLFDKDGKLIDETPTAEPCLPIILDSHYKEIHIRSDNQMDDITVQPSPSEVSGIDPSANIDQLHSPIPTTVETSHNEPSSEHADSMSPEIQAPSPIPPRRSNRQRQPPSRLGDYYCDVVIQNRTSPHAISKVISYDGLTPAHRQCLPVPDFRGEWNHAKTTFQEIKVN
nr:Retrovirus-related Pol polyprotein from transposon TNT 1-94 [Ipomoea batatas]